MVRSTLLLSLLFAVLFSHGQSVKNFSNVSKPEDGGFSESRLARLDKMLEEHVNNQWVPGAVALIVRDGKIVYYKSFGFSDIDKKMPLKKDDIFRIASQSKAITALAVMM
jgi:CubicO group peptidase (beta-lactamase class C family)